MAAAQAAQGFRHTLGLTAAATDKTGALVAACGASRGGGFQLSGTWTATILFEQSLDAGTTWIAKTVYPALGGLGVTTTAANGQWKFVCGGETHIRVRCSAFTSGTIVVDATFTAGVDTAGTAGTPGGLVQTVQPPSVASATSSNVASSATSVTIVAANAARQHLSIFNDDANPLLIKYGATASATSYKLKILGGGYWERPYGDGYTGIIDGIWDADGSGSARVTEQ